MTKFIKHKYGRREKIEMKCDRRLKFYHAQFPSHLSYLCYFWSLFGVASCKKVGK